MPSFIIRFVYATVLVGFCYGSCSSQEMSKTNLSNISSSSDAHENKSFVESFGVQRVAVANDIPSTSWLHQLQNIWFALASAMSVALLIMIYSYLRNISIVNESLLLHLYKDVVAIFIFMRIVLISKGILGSFLLTKSEEHISMNQNRHKSCHLPFLVQHLLS